jgi:hypothetical protein
MPFKNLLINTPTNQTTHLTPQHTPSLRRSRPSMASEIAGKSATATAASPPATDHKSSSSTPTPPLPLSSTPLRAAPPPPTTKPPLLFEARGSTPASPSGGVSVGGGNNNLGGGGTTNNNDNNWRWVPMNDTCGCPLGYEADGDGSTPALPPLHPRISKNVKGVQRISLTFTIGTCVHL